MSPEDWLHDFTSVPRGRARIHESRDPVDDRLRALLTWPEPVPEPEPEPVIRRTPDPSEIVIPSVIARPRTPEPEPDAPVTAHAQRETPAQFSEPVRPISQPEAAPRPARRRGPRAITSAPVMSPPFTPEPDVAPIEAPPAEVASAAQESAPEPTPTPDAGSIPMLIRRPATEPSVAEDDAPEPAAPQPTSGPFFSAESSGLTEAERVFDEDEDEDELPEPPSIAAERDVPAVVIPSLTRSSGPTSPVEEQETPPVEVDVDVEPEPEPEILIETELPPREEPEVVVEEAAPPAPASVLESNNLLESLDVELDDIAEEAVEVDVEEAEVQVHVDVEEPVEVEEVAAQPATPSPADEADVDVDTEVDEHEELPDEVDVIVDQPAAEIPPPPTPPVQPRTPPPAPSRDIKPKKPPPAPAAARDAAREPPPAPAKEGKGKPRVRWFEEAFAEHFLATTTRDAGLSAELDVEFIKRAVKPAAGSSVLDVGCGPGWHCLAFASGGFDVTGIDSSRDLLSFAAQKSDQKSATVNFQHGDMRALPRERTYDLVTCLGTSFGYFDDEQNRACLIELRDQLKPEGKLVIQIVNRDYMMRFVPCRSWWQGKSCLVLDVADMNAFSSRLKVQRTIVFEDRRQFEHTLSVRTYTLHELGRLLRGAGLRVVEVSGSRDTPGRFFGATSPDIWIVAERRSDP
ncbi:MAG: methyltransferase domain-containing protein [Nannocystaceae bacterium]